MQVQRSGVDGLMDFDFLALGFVGLILLLVWW